MKESNKIIIGVVGEMGSGKSTVARYIKEKYKASSYKFSDILRDILEKLSLPVTRDNLIDLFLILAPRFGEDVLATPMKQAVEKDPNSYIVVEGIRRPADISRLKELPHFYLLGIQSDSKTRFERIHARHERSDDQEKSYQEFLEDHKKFTEIYAPEMAQQAPYIITNNGTSDELYKQIDATLDSIVKNIYAPYEN
jgi:dephospho-CoA kinase